MSEIRNLSVGQAQACIMENISPGSVENISPGSVEAIALERSLGRVLAEDIRANRDLPPYDISAMDGFAVRSCDLADGQVALAVIEDIKAGDMPKRAIAAGQCARIMTGAPVPKGADAVVRVEDTHVLGDGCIGFGRSVKPGNDIRIRGEAMRDGAVVLSAGTEITPGVIGVLATVKKARVTVYRRPRVAILSSGDELEALDAPFNPQKIPESNSYAVMAQLQVLGVEPVRLGIAADDPEELADYLRRGLDYDVLLVSGGSSVGVHDHVRPTLEALGVTIHFWRVEMRPGHPLVFGSRGSCLVFGLPGNPVSSMVCVEEFVVPAVRRLMGHSRLYRSMVSARMTHAVKHSPGRAEFIRVALASDVSGTLLATSTGSQSSGDLLSMARADGLLIVPTDNVGFAVGDSVRVQPFECSNFQAISGFETDA